MAYPLPSDPAYPTFCPIQLRVTKVINGEFEKLEDLKVEDVSLTCDTSLEVFNNEFNRLCRMDDDLFTYEVEVANISCDSNMDDDSKHEADDDMGYDPSDVTFTKWLGSNFFNYKTMDHYIMKALWIYWIRGNDEVELTDEETSGNEDDVAEVFRIDTNIIHDETPLCLAFNEFNSLLKVDPDLLTKDIMGFQTYKDYKNNWIYEWNENVPWVWREDGYCNGRNLPEAYHIRNSLHYQDLEWYEALEDSELKDEALRNKAIMEGLISDDESSNDCWKRWNSHEIYYHDYDEGEYKNKTREEGHELCGIKTREVPVCQIKRYEMIKYSFNNEEEYVAVKEDEYDDLTITRPRERNIDEYWWRIYKSGDLEEIYFFVRDLHETKFLTGSRRNLDLYTISLSRNNFINLILFMAKASPTQAWLCHRRLSHLNFDYITLLSKKEVVNGLPKLKYVKDQLCSSCEMSKAKRSSFKTKAVPSSKGRLNLLHMDLCGPMRVASINGKKIYLVIVDDYSRYTWTLFYDPRMKHQKFSKTFSR
ncbi:VIER F-box protein 2 [Tanacetum coccineum]